MHIEVHVKGGVVVMYGGHRVERTITHTQDETYPSKVVVVHHVWWKRGCGSLIPPQCRWIDFRMLLELGVILCH